MIGQGSARDRRPGFSLVEECLSLAIAGIVFAGLLQAVGGVRRMAERHGATTTRAVALRTAAAVLHAEVRDLAPAADLRAVAGDSLVIRSFRGAATVCGTTPGRLLVRYRGMREPDPAKDSVLVVDTAGGIATYMLSGSSASTGCATWDRERVYAWTGTPPLETGAFLLLFEPGSYSLSGNALRYRVGRAGRQPLTPEEFSRDAHFGLERVGAASVAVNVELAPRVRLGGLSDSARFRISLRNALPESGP